MRTASNNRPLMRRKPIWSPNPNLSDEARRASISARSVAVNVKNASISKPLSSRGSCFRPRKVACHLFIAPPPQPGYDRPEKLRTATACFIEQNTISVLKLPANHTVTFGSKNEGTPRSTAAGVRVCDVADGLRCAELLDTVPGQAHAESHADADDRAGES